MMARFWPLKPGTYSIASGFGNRAGGFHRGVDFAAKDGTPIYAAQAGTVVHIGAAQGFGQWIVIDHPAGDGAGTTVYGHMWDAFAAGLKQGQRVEAAQLIGYVGSNGQSSGPHLHFEVHPTVWRAGSQVDPLPWLAGAREVGAPVAPKPTPPPPALSGGRPEFRELDFYSGKRVGQGFSVRSRRPINFFLHTEEGNGTAESLARYCDGSNGVSYHYTVRDRIVCNVVDTDYYSWSVLNANVFSINLCFAGSRAGWSQAQWMQRDADIAIAAFLAVQDCRKYGIPTTVIAPPYRQAAGISDHRYVTRQLGIGTHTDVGDQFPWGRFAAYVAKYATGTTPPPSSGGFLMALSDVEQQELLDLARQQAEVRRPSRSPLDWPGSAYRDTCAGYAWSADANAHVILVERLAVEYGDPQAIAQLVAVASMDEGQFPDRQGHKQLAARILTKVSPEARTVGEEQIRKWLAAEAAG